MYVCIYMHMSRKHCAWAYDRSFSQTQNVHSPSMEPFLCFLDDCFLMVLLMMTTTTTMIFPSSKTLCSWLYSYSIPFPLSFSFVFFSFFPQFYFEFPCEKWRQESLRLREASKSQNVLGERDKRDWKENVFWFSRSTTHREQRISEIFAPSK